MLKSWLYNGEMNLDVGYTVYMLGSGSIGALEEVSMARNLSFTRMRSGYASNALRV
jgi:hypothetical protein